MCVLAGKLTRCAGFRGPGPRARLPSKVTKPQDGRPTTRGPGHLHCNHLLPHRRSPRRTARWPEAALPRFKAPPGRPEVSLATIVLLSLLTGRAVIRVIRVFGSWCTSLRLLPKGILWRKLRARSLECRRRPALGGGRRDAGEQGDLALRTRPEVGQLYSGGVLSLPPAASAASTSAATLTSAATHASRHISSSASTFGTPKARHRRRGSHASVAHNAHFETRALRARKLNLSLRPRTRKANKLCA